MKIKDLFSLLLGLAAVILVIILFAIKLFKELVREKTKTLILREKEHFLYIDALTDVYNRNYYNHKVRDKLDTWEYPQTIIVSYISDLKIVNDNYGHLIGDELLKSFANILIETFPECNLILRMGGDEFHLIFENTSEEQMVNKISKVKRIISEKSLAVGGDKSIKISAAFGYATRNCSEESIDAIIALADKRMYEDKSRTKGRTNI